MASEMVMAIGNQGLEPATPAKFRSVVFTRNRGVNESLKDVRLAGMTVGVFDDAGMAWDAATEASRSRDSFGHTIIVDDPDAVAPGGKTIEDAMRMVTALRLWASENVPTEQTEPMEKVLDALAKTLTWGWGEVDESLSSLSRAKRAMNEGQAELAADCFSAGVGMLHRWQGRNGRIGNVD